MPQPPQLALLVVDVSQPLRALPSQSAKPGLHEAIVHIEPSQPGTALGTVQRMPQPPQFRVESRATSHPSLADELQLPKPGAQASIRHTPPPQSGVAFMGAQGVAQPPQSVGESREVSHPVVASASQSPNPGSHASIWQPPVTQAVVATWVPPMQSIAGSPSSTSPSQSLSAASQTSVALSFVSGSSSSQSMPRQPTPVPWRSSSPSTQQRSPRGAQTALGSPAMKSTTQLNRGGQEGMSGLQEGRQARPPPTSTQ